MGSAARWLWDGKERSMSRTRNGFFETLAGPAALHDAEGFAALEKKYNIAFAGSPPEPAEDTMV